MDLFIINTPPLDVFEHMAFDETLAADAALSGGGSCFLRFYNWGGLPPAATFGYAQFFSDVKKEFGSKNFKGPFTRRPTGGGVVYHEDDLTFSLIFRSSSPRAAQIYEMLHGAINAQIRGGLVGATAKEAYAPRVGGVAGICFSNPVENDILDAAGKKILGGAIRKFGNTVLYQGSLQRSGARNDERLKAQVRAALENLWNSKFECYEFDGNFISAALASADSVYKTQQWIQKF
ncbi:MAG: hypothetical protein LBI01_01630 [Elusimicrobium sp.]|jgi:lipoate-protein ligase A|nr:hypothetical protein [Elusimicrobium sp.]